MSYFTRVRKYNPNHDPKNGQFTSGDGGGGGEGSLPKGWSMGTPQRATDGPGYENYVWNNKRQIARGMGSTPEEATARAHAEAMKRTEWNPGPYNSIVRDLKQMESNLSRGGQFAPKDTPKPIPTATGSAAAAVRAYTDAREKAQARLEWWNKEGRRNAEIMHGKNHPKVVAMDKELKSKATREANRNKKKPYGAKLDYGPWEAWPPRRREIPWD